MFASSSKDVLQFRNAGGLRYLARKIALHGLSFFQNVDFAKPRLIFFSFHFTFEEDKANLRKIVLELSKNFQFVSYSEAIDMLTSGVIEKNTICFSSDDGFRNFCNATEVFEDFGISAMLFACPGYVGEKNVDRLKQFNHQRLNGPLMDLMDWDELKDLIKKGHEVGNHTWSHFNLSELSKDQMQEEISKSHDTLIKYLGTSNHFAWPYGKPYKIQDTTISFTKSLGYESVASTVRGFYDSDHLLENQYIKRNNFEPFWPLNHVKYFAYTNKYK